MAATEQELFTRARQAMDNAYAPYSGYRVGACIETDDGQLFTGCNMENASYGLAICAERSAVCAAIAAGARRFRRIAVCSAGSMPWPCGACRQVLNEFSPDILVLVQDGEGRRDSALLTALLPMSFGPHSL